MKVIILSVFLLTSCSTKNWKEASRESVNIAPKAEELTEPIFQIYYARAFSWRGIFGIHPWVAWKRTEDKQYTVAQVTSWNIRRTGTAVRIEQDLPDRKWFDREPTLLFEVRGKKALTIIEKAEKEIENYPFKNVYTLWPGPNSNTFVAHLIRQIDEIKIELPPHAVGKDYLANGDMVVASPSNTGLTFSTYGYLGLTIGAQEGIEFNVLGLHFGIDFWTPAFKLPLIGRLGFPDDQIN